MAFTKRGGRRRRRKTKRRKLSKQSHRKHLRRSRRGGLISLKYAASKIAQGAEAAKSKIAQGARAVKHAFTDYSPLEDRAPGDFDDSSWM